MESHTALEYIFFPGAFFTRTLKPGMPNWEPATRFLAMYYFFFVARTCGWHGDQTGGDFIPNEKLQLHFRRIFLFRPLPAECRRGPDTPSADWPDFELDANTRHLDGDLGGSICSIRPTNLGRKRCFLFFFFFFFLGGWHWPWRPTTSVQGSHGTEGHSTARQKRSLCSLETCRSQRAKAG
jgi:hypothetical protein